MSRAACQLRGFTLAEVLVVIGIMGLLLALLFPVLSRTRKSAASLECAANLKEIAAGALMWAAEHRGFLPLDGEVVVHANTVGTNSLPRALNDSGRRRYAYTVDDGSAGTSTSPPTLESPTPFLVTLFIEFNRRAGSPAIAPTAAWTSLEQRHRSARVFHCPRADRATYWLNSSIEGVYSLILVVGDVGYSSPWHTTFDYATNTGLLGFHHEDRYGHRRYAGNTSKIRRASRMVVCGDSGSHGLSWTPSLNRVSRQVTLRDVWRATGEIRQSSAVSSKLDPKRHDGVVNVAFADGHVSAVRLDDASLAECELLQE